MEAPMVIEILKQDHVVEVTSSDMGRVLYEEGNGCTGIRLHSTLPEVTGWSSWNLRPNNALGLDVLARIEAIVVEELEKEEELIAA